MSVDRLTPTQQPRPDLHLAPGEEAEPSEKSAMLQALDLILAQSHRTNANLEILATEQRSTNERLAALESRMSVFGQKQDRHTDVQEAQNKHLDTLTTALLRLNKGGR